MQKVKFIPTPVEEWQKPMIDREKVLAVLRKRFPDARWESVAAAANAIVGLEPDYEPVEAAQIARLDCDAGAQHYTVDDVASGRLRLFRQTAGD